MFDKSFLKDTLSQIIAGLAVALLTAGWFFRDQLFILFEVISKPIALPVYLIWVVFFLGAGLHYLWYRIHQRRQKTYKDYQKDEFWGIIWKWEYEPRKEVYKDSIEAICPDCNSKMVIYDFKNEDNGTYTSVDCKSDDCIYSSYKNEEHDFEFAGGKEILFRKVATKVDKNLRNMGLKL